MEVIQFPPANDKISRSRRYRISRMRNVLVNAHNALGRLGRLPEDLIDIDRGIFQTYENLGTLVARLEAVQPPANKKTSATPPSPARHAFYLGMTWGNA
jgi:hypothetical protein